MQQYFECMIALDLSCHTYRTIVGDTHELLSWTACALRFIAGSACLGICSNCTKISHLDRSILSFW